MTEDQAELLLTARDSLAADQATEQIAHAQQFQEVADQVIGPIPSDEPNAT